MITVFDAPQIARGLHSLAANQEGVWVPAFGAQAPLRDLLKMWTPAALDIFRVQAANPGDPLDAVLQRWGLEKHFQGRPGAGICTTSVIRVLPRARPDLVRVRSAHANQFHYMLSFPNSAVITTVFELPGKEPAPVARIGIKPGWLYAVGVPRSLTSLELFAKACEVLARLKDKQRSSLWSSILLPSVEFAGTQPVDWLRNASFNPGLSLAGAFQSMELSIELAPADDIVLPPKVAPGTPPPAVFNSSTLLFATDTQQRIKWLCRYGAENWALYAR